MPKYRVTWSTLDAAQIPTQTKVLAEDEEDAKKRFFEAMKVNFGILLSDKHVFLVEKLAPDA